ncbi:hypothetical protein STH2806 [Symbiobacterium thermophilum IAM 14863]|uniref:Cardiolipin synthase N-terminal domain-containing protein n=2 Tax=Symbiobacterium thermophilum TaxID=2734 RepID=Q67KK7_SYMTH|nr:hypothetical protein STH2806 [Symbiobacterium thermophilum IAM 14863]
MADVQSYQKCLTDYCPLPHYRNWVPTPGGPGWQPGPTEGEGLGMAGFLVALLWLASILIFLWIWDDATRRHGQNIGCLWALAVLALGPIAIIAYFLFGRSEN